MQVFLGTALLKPQWTGSVVCIGTFDGVHLGHREVVRTAVELGNELGLPTVLVTFDRHPAASLAPERCPPSISSLCSNLLRFGQMGVAVCVVLEFDPQFALQTADQFFEDELEGVLRAKAMVVGHDFAFGHQRQGTPQWLAQRLRTVVVPPFSLDGHRVSSSVIRAAVAEGNVEKANHLLGRPFGLEGVVVPGERIGRQLGYPTANLALLFNQVVPADGVYAGRCQTPFGTFTAAASVGMRPTVGGQSRAIEAYLLDYPGQSLYGSPIQIDFVKRLRGQVNFPNVQALQQQMALDVAETSQVMENG